MREEPRPLSLQRKSVPLPVEAAVARALEKLPADRWQTAAEFSAALTASGGSGRRRLPRVPNAGVILGALAAAAVLALAWVDLRGERGAPPSAGPVRFGVELDSGTEPTFTPIVKLSADGRNLFITANVHRQEEILHRPLGQMRMRTIAGAGLGEQGTGNNRPFLSPDGRWIAFAAQGKLRKVPVERRTRDRPGPGRVGRRELGEERVDRLHPGLQHRPLDRERGWRRCPRAHDGRHGERRVGALVAAGPSRRGRGSTWC